MGREGFPDLHTSWRSFSEQLDPIDNLTIQRNILINNAVDIQIHSFCDASLTGYGACLYVLSCNNHGNVRVILMSAKGRVAALSREADKNNGRRAKKGLTIPRFELCGALVLSRVYLEALNFKFCNGCRNHQIFERCSKLFVFGRSKPSPGTFIGDTSGQIKILLMHFHVVKVHGDFQITKPGSIFHHGYLTQSPNGQSPS